MLLNRAVSLELIERVKARHPFQAQWARDAQGRFAIGYGRRAPVAHGRPITATEAELLLIHDLNALANLMDERLLPVLSLREMGELVVWTYEQGQAQFERLGLARVINSQGFAAADRLMAEQPAEPIKAEASEAGPASEPPALGAEPFPPEGDLPQVDGESSAPQRVRARELFSPELPITLAALCGFSLFGGALLALLKHPTLIGLGVGLVGVVLMAPMIVHMIAVRLEPRRTA
jgi:GH24 family phage-related lysozyme (muramidase)